MLEILSLQLNINKRACWCALRVLERLYGINGIRITERMKNAIRCRNAKMFCISERTDKSILRWFCRVRRMEDGWLVEKGVEF